MTACRLPQCMSEIARLSVEIDDVTPRVLRVVEVPADIRLDDLHFVLQIAIGWQNGHPFEFRIGDKVWGQPDRDADVESDAGRASDARAISSRKATRSNTTMCSARTGSTR